MYNSNLSFLIGEIPWWKRPFICFKNFRLWKEVRRIDKAAVIAFRYGCNTLWNALIQQSDRLWREIYNLPKS